MLEGLAYIIAGAIFMLVIGAAAFARGRREASAGKELSRLTRVLMLLSFGGLGATIALAALTRAWPFSPPDGWPAPLINAAGVVLVTLGACVVVSVFVGSRKRTWAVDTDALATTGIYARTRNPRALGWFLIYLGLALASLSAAALALAPMLLLGYLPWILLEEAALERHFGDEYRAYRTRTPRFI